MAKDLRVKLAQVIVTKEPAPPASQAGPTRNRVQEDPQRRANRQRSFIRIDKPERQARINRLPANNAGVVFPSGSDPHPILFLHSAGPGARAFNLHVLAALNARTLLLWETLEILAGSWLSSASLFSESPVNQLEDSRRVTAQVVTGIERQREITAKEIQKNALQAQEAQRRVVTQSIPVARSNTVIQAHKTIIEDQRYQLAVYKDTTERRRQDAPRYFLPTGRA